MICKKCGAEYTGSVCDYCGADNDYYELVKCSFCGHKTNKSICECCGNPVKRANLVAPVIPVAPTMPVFLTPTQGDSRKEMPKNPIGTSEQNERLERMISDIAEDDEQLYKIAIMYLGGVSGKDSDVRLALSALSKSARMGNAKAAFKLGEIFEGGAYGFSQDNDSAMFWYGESAKKGYEPARLWFKLRGILPEQNEAKNESGKAEFSNRPIEKKPNVNFDIDALMRSVFIIRSSAGTGTGFVLTDGTVVTNMHVIGNYGAPKGEVWAIDCDGKGAELEFLYGNGARDVAFLRFKNGVPEGACLYLAPAEDLKISDRVFTVGNPLGRGLSYSEGVVAQKGAVIKGMKMIKTNMSLYFGNSGGPLCNEEGDVVGMLTLVGKDDDDQIVPEASYAIPTEIIGEELERCFGE